MPDARKLFETLVREHADMLTVYLTSALGDVADVDDVFQETMIVAWRRLDNFDHTRPFAPWLRGIARNIVLSQSRQRATNMCSPAILDQLESRLEQIGARSGDTWTEKIDALRTCVQALPGHYRECVTERYHRQQAIRDVSKILKLSVAVVKKRLQRARALILECMERNLAISEHRP